MMYMWNEIEVDNTVRCMKEVSYTLRKEHLIDGQHIIGIRVSLLISEQGTDDHDQPDI